MHLGIDARMYGIHNRGIGRYLSCLIKGLENREKDGTRYTIFTLPAIADKLELDPGLFTIVRVNAPWYSWREHWEMPRAIKKSKVEAMHWPHLNVSYWCPVPYVVTIHDLIISHFPDSRATTLPTWKYRLKLKGYQAVLKKAVRKARAIITVSEFTKRDIMRHLKVPAHKIRVIYPGTDQMILGTDQLDNSPQLTAKLKDKYGLGLSYLLYVGSAYPHKNLEALVDAHFLLRTEYDRNWQLVLAGRLDAFYGRLMKYVAERAPDKAAKESVIFTGEVNDRELDGLYRGARMFVFPSRYEGFGLPPLEAMSRRVPVAAAKASSLPEVLSDAAYYFDPARPDYIAYALDMLGRSKELQSDLVARGLERIKHFSWDKMAEETVDVWQEAFGK